MAESKQKERKKDCGRQRWLENIGGKQAKVFDMWQFDGFSVDAAQKLIQAGDGSGVAALAQLYPEYHQTSVRVPATHVPDQFDLRLCVLSGMAVGPVGAVGQ